MSQSVDIRYLFNSMDEAFDPRKAADAGYTHLIADTKKNKILANDLERRVKKDYPEAFEQCLSYARQKGKVDMIQPLKWLKMKSQPEGIYIRKCPFNPVSGMGRD